MTDEEIEAAIREDIDEEAVSFGLQQLSEIEPFTLNRMMQKDNIFKKLVTKIKDLWNYLVNTFKGSSSYVNSELKYARKMADKFNKLFNETADFKGEASNLEVNTTRYSLKQEAIEEIEQAISDKNYDKEIELTDCSPAILVGQKGVKNLPLRTNASHARENILTEEEAEELGLSVTPDKHFHGLGKELYLKVISGLDEVTRAYRGTKNADNSDRRENYFLLISQYKDAEGDTINVPVYINKGSIYNEVYMVVNKVATVFGKKILKHIYRES